MDPALVVTLAAAAAGLLALVCALLVQLVGRRRLQRDLAESRERLETLARRVEELQAPPPRPAASETEYLITTVGRQEPEPPEAKQVEPLTAQQFASVALGESLVRILAFGYGVRRALSAENRNRIRFEVRREIRRSRKQRRRDLKEARHRLRFEAPAETDAEDAA
jgi:hypothetical protein